MDNFHSCCNVSSKNILQDHVKRRKKLENENNNENTVTGQQTLRFCHNVLITIKAERYYYIIANLSLEIIT